MNDHQSWWEVNTSTVNSVGASSIFQTQNIGGGRDCYIYSTGIIAPLKGNPFYGAGAILAEELTMGIVWGDTGSILALRSNPQIDASKEAARNGRAGPLIKGLSLVMMAAGSGKITKSATQIAREGGKHAGQLGQFMKQTPEQLRKTMRSFDKQIAKHEGWIKDPTSKVKNFNDLRPEHQQNLIHHWQQDIAWHQELKSIAQDVLKGL